MSENRLALGAAMMLGAIFLFSIMDTIAKELTTRHHPLRLLVRQVQGRNP